MPETLTATAQHIEVTRLAGHIGAEISGVDTGAPFSGEVIAKIRHALLHHKVVFLRDQGLNYRRQVAFAERLAVVGDRGDDQLIGVVASPHEVTPFRSLAANGAVKTT